MRQVPRSYSIGEKAKARLRYFIGEAIRKGMSDEKAQRVLIAQIIQDPLTTVERLMKVLPDDPQPEKGGGQALNLNFAFLEGLKAVQLPAPARAALEGKVAPEPDTEW